MGRLLRAQYFVADIAAFPGIAMAWSSRYGGQPHPFVCVPTPQPMPAPGAALISPISGFREWSGRSLALAVARYLVMFLKRPGGQAQFSTILALQGAEDRFGALHSWMAGRLTDDLSLPALARKAGMSERSFSRHYVEATGMTPARAVERLRVEATRRLLSDTRLPVKRVAVRCGFGSEETLRRSFVRLLAATPQDYRARFSG